MQTFEPQDPNYESRVRATFAQQGLMASIGARMTTVRPGAVEIELVPRDDITQQHGFVHGAIIAAIVDSACGFAAATLFAAAAGVLTVEYKINFIAPARGEKFIARGRVKKTGRTLTVCEGDAFAITGGEEKLVAAMQGTMISLSV